MILYLGVYDFETIIRNVSLMNHPSMSFHDRASNQEGATLRPWNFDFGITWRSLVDDLLIEFLWGQPPLLHYSIYREYRKATK